MSLFGTVSSPTAGVCVLIFQPQDAVHVHVAGLLPILMHLLSLCFSLTHMHRPTSTAGYHFWGGTHESMESFKVYKQVLWRPRKETKDCEALIDLALGAWLNAWKISSATLDIPVGRGWEVNLILRNDVSEVTLFASGIVSKHSSASKGKESVHQSWCIDCF